MPNSNVPNVYCDAHLSVNVTTTGSMDKSIFEAMACGVPVITSNRALDEDFPDLICKENSADDLAAKIGKLISLEDKEYSMLRELVREYVVSEHGIGQLVDKIISVS